MPGELGRPEQKENRRIVQKRAEERARRKRAHAFSDLKAIVRELCVEDADLLAPAILGMERRSNADAVIFAAEVIR